MINLSKVIGFRTIGNKKENEKEYHIEKSYDESEKRSNWFITNLTQFLALLTKLTAILMARRKSDFKIIKIILDGK